MESKAADKQNGKTRITVYVEPETARRLWQERVDTGRKLSHQVEEVLARHFERTPPVVTG